MACLANSPRPTSPFRGRQDARSGQVEWKPVRYGKQIWEIGYPNRTGDKFYKGDGENYWLWGWCVRYGELFPHDITYTIGKSDYRRDWFFEQVPHELSDAWKNASAKDPAQSAVRLGKHGRARRRTVAEDQPRPGDHLDHQVQHEPSPAAARPRSASPWPAPTARRPRRGGQRTRRRHAPSRADQRPALQHEQERLAGTQTALRRRMAEIGRERNVAHGPGRRSHFAASFTTICDWNLTKAR